MLKVTRSRLQQYSVAAFSVGLALLLMLVLNPWLAMTKTALKNLPKARHVWSFVDKSERAD